MREPDSGQRSEMIMEVATKSSLSLPALPAAPASLPEVRVLAAQDIVGVQASIALTTLALTVLTMLRMAKWPNGRLARQ